MDQDIEPETPNRCTSISVLEFQRDVRPLDWSFACVLTFGPPLELDNDMVWKNEYIITSLIKDKLRETTSLKKKKKKSISIPMKYHGLTVGSSTPNRIISLPLRPSNTVLRSIFCSLLPFSSRFLLELGK